MSYKDEHHNPQDFASCQSAGGAPPSPNPHCVNWRETCVSHRKTNSQLSAESHNRRIKIHEACLQVLLCMTLWNPSGYCQLKPSQEPCS